MGKYRSEVIKLANSWIGLKESDGSYKKIIDIYNSYGGPFPRGLKMKYDWSWCACTWSALAIKLGYTDIMPIEISCGKLVDAAKKMGVWVENDAYIPSPGDAILYDWDDDGKGDDQGWPDHVGTVVSVSSDGKSFVVVEGNCSNAVKTRTMKVDGKYIRGFITPKYDPEPIIVDEPKKEEEKSSPSVIIDMPYKVVKATEPARKKDPSLAGTYITTGNLNCRNGVGVVKKSLVIIPKGTKVQCYGFYSTNTDGTKWLSIEFVLKGVKYTGGFSSIKYLKKV